jgi:CRP/FNR family transcriptional regulator
VYAVRSGSLKTFSIMADGREQVTGFYLPGELVGLDAISLGRHPSSAKALESSSICELSFLDLEALGEQIPGLQRQILRVMSRELLDDELLLMLIGKKTAEERLAAFLVTLAMRFRLRGFSATEYNLSMSRSDIGNYLGLAVETVSRLFTRFQHEELLSVKRRRIHIHDLEKLSMLAGESALAGNPRNRN